MNRARCARFASAVLAAAVAAPVLAGCGEDPFAPDIQPVPEEPSEVTLGDLTESDLELPSAFDILSARAVRTDQTSAWDFVYVVPSEDGEEFRPRGLVTGEESRAGIQRVESSFEELTEAPADGYEQDTSVPIEEGSVYAAVSRRDPRFGQILCRRFVKLEILSVDDAGRTVTLRHLANPNCEQRILIPGAEVDD